MDFWEGKYNEKNLNTATINLNFKFPPKLCTYLDFSFMSSTRISVYARSEENDVSNIGRQYKSGIHQSYGSTGKFWREFKTGFFVANKNFWFRRSEMMIKYRRMSDADTDIIPKIYIAESFFLSS